MIRSTSPRRSVACSVRKVSQKKLGLVAGVPGRPGTDGVPMEEVVIVPVAVLAHDVQALRRLDDLEQRVAADEGAAARG